MGMCIFLRKGGFLTKPGSRLPSGYTELEYIQSTGEQLINARISVPHASARVVVDFEPTSVTGDHNPITGHANTTFNWTTNFLFINGSKSTITLNGVDSGIVTSVGDRYVVDYSCTSYSVNGGGSTPTTQSFTDGYNDTIFYSSGYYGKLKLYAYQLYDNDTIVRDFVPAMNSSGAVGLYDRENGVFYTNEGSGAFIAGPEVA